MHKRNVKFNTLRHGRQFVNERLLLLQRLRAGRYNRTTIAGKQPTWSRAQADDVKRCWLISNVDRRQRDIGIDQNRYAAVVDRQVVSCMRLRTIDDVVSSAT